MYCKTESQTIIVKHKFQKYAINMQNFIKPNLRIENEKNRINLIFNKYLPIEP